MKKIFLVFSLLALSGENVFGVDNPETLNSESFKEGQVENQRNLYHFQKRINNLIC